MDRRIPLPTDNIYKFYALFGLLLIITGVLASVYVHKTTNDLIFNAALEIQAVDDLAKAGTDGRNNSLLLKKVEIAVSDRITFLVCLGAVIDFGGMLAYYGFSKWHKELQPLQDRLLTLQVRKAEREERLAERVEVALQDSSESR